MKSRWLADDTRFTVATALLAMLLLGDAVLAEGAGHEPRELVQERQKRAADEEKKHQGPKTSDWGPAERGVQTRVTAPVEIEQGMPIEVTIEFQSDPEKLPAGVRELNTFLRDRHLELSLRDRETGKTWKVKPYDPTSGLPPPRDEGKSVVPLDRASPQKWTSKFPLAEVYESLPPGSYEASVRLSFPEKQRTSPRQWHGSVVSGPLPLTIAPATSKTEILCLPKRLHLSRTLTRLRAGDPEETAIPAITFTKEDAQEVTVPVRNGHFVGTWIYRDGEPSTLDGGPPHPVSRNVIDTWYDYKGGGRGVSYRIEVFETADPPQHGWMPGLGSAGYKTLWKGTFKIGYAEEEIQKTLASPPPTEANEDNG